jgi:hypothetical protein
MEVVFIATGVTGDGKTQMKPLVAGDKVSEETRIQATSRRKCHDPPLEYAGAWIGVDSPEHKEVDSLPGGHHYRSS